MTEEKQIEIHPFEPYLPVDAKVLIMGTFPPQPKRWSMEFFYPNRTNDFWPMMALIFKGDRKALLARDGKTFDLDAIKALLYRHHIALYDTGHKIRRLKDNASDKFLDIIEPVDLYGVLERIPKCKTIGTTGEKAANIIANLTHSEAPAMGCKTITPDGLSHWRLPSTSRAYPLALEKKAEYYRRMFQSVGLV
ncbi:MAG: uracil-DNA glycosylase family protein [Muribaculaceae bacterium]|nr:uracil-DNA glycosylase family protein [Muribaculaceae bacterium]